MLPTSLTKRLVNHAPPQDVTEGYAGVDEQHPASRRDPSPNPHARSGRPSPCPNRRAHLLHCEEHARRVACEGRESEAFIPRLAARERIFAAIRDDVENDCMAAGDVGNHARLLEDVVHEDTAETVTLRRLVHRDLPQEQHRDLPVIGRPPAAGARVRPHSSCPS